MCKKSPSTLSVNLFLNLLLYICLKHLSSKANLIPLFFLFIYTCEHHFLSYNLSSVFERERAGWFATTSAEYVNRLRRSLSATSGQLPLVFSLLCLRSSRLNLISSAFPSPPPLQIIKLSSKKCNFPLVHLSDNKAGREVKRQSNLQNGLQLTIVHGLLAHVRSMYYGQMGSQRVRRRNL